MYFSGNFFTMFTIFKKLFLLLPLLAGAPVDAYASPGGCSGYCYTHDPSVIQRASDGVYFRFNTGGGVGISKSSSIAGPWTYEGNALADGSSINLSGNTDLWVR
jgi:arabinan endo-1,5-alpha-L-arabinosidase